MESTSSSGSSSGGFFSGLGNTFLDLLDKVGNAAINQEFGENAAEQNEGAGEFANPGTVSQPVHPSQLPSGQPLNLHGIASSIGLSIPVLLALIAGGVYFFVIRK